MAYDLSKVLQGLYQKLGQSSTSTTSGDGTTTTTVDSKFADYFDDDFCVNGALILVRDAAGAGASPEGCFGVITGYDSSTQTITHGALDAATGAGDTFMYTSALFPLYNMIEIINLSLRFIGKMPFVDTSITTAAQQTEHSLPLVAGGKELALVEIQTRTDDANDNRYIPVPNYRLIPATAGTQWTIVVPQYAAGYKIRVTYMDFHPTLSVHDSPVSTHIPTPYLEAVATAHALQWFNRRTGGGEDYWKFAENQAWNEVERARLLYDMWTPEYQPKVLNLGYYKTEDGVPDPIT